MFSLALFLALYAPAFRGVLEPRRVIARLDRVQANSFYQWEAFWARRDGVQCRGVSGTRDTLAFLSRLSPSKEPPTLPGVFLAAPKSSMSCSSSLSLSSFLVSSSSSSSEKFNCSRYSSLGLSAEARHGIEFDLLMRLSLSSRMRLFNQSGCTTPFTRILDVLQSCRKGDNFLHRAAQTTFVILPIENIAQVWHFASFSRRSIFQPLAQIFPRDRRIGCS